MSSSISRLANLWKGFLSLFVSNLEKENPEAVYEAAIHGRKEQYKQLKGAVAGIIVLRNKLASELEGKEARLRDVDAQVAVAVDAGEDEAALVLLQQKEELQARVAELSRDLSKASEEADKAKAGILGFQGEIEKLEREKATMLARRENAQARIQIQESLSGLSVQADLKALDTVRQDIHKLQAEADVSAELGETSIESKLDRIRAQTGQVAAKQKLEALKKAREAERAGAAEAVAKKSL